MTNVKEVRQALERVCITTTALDMNTTPTIENYGLGDLQKDFKKLDQFITDVEDKETPKKPIWVRANEHITVDDHELSCPYCEKAIRFDFIAPKYRPKRCEWCGQMLDWSEEKND